SLHLSVSSCPFLFFLILTSSSAISTLSLHDALPISPPPSTHGSSRSSAHCPCRSTTRGLRRPRMRTTGAPRAAARSPDPGPAARSEEHTSELQSRENLVCRLLLEKKKKHKKENEK